MPDTRARTSTSREPLVCATYSVISGTSAAFMVCPDTGIGGIWPPWPAAWSAPPLPQAASSTARGSNTAIEGLVGLTECSLIGNECLQSGGLSDGDACWHGRNDSHAVAMFWLQCSCWPADASAMRRVAGDPDNRNCTQIATA